MSQFIETIKLLDGQFYNLDYHQRRLEETQCAMGGKITIDLKKKLLAEQKRPSQGLFKTRVIYDQQIQLIEFVPYSIKPIQYLKIVEADTIDYGFKFENRTSLNNLYEQRNSCDEIIIVKNKMITDASYANIVFKRGEEWITPISYLLNGTMRQYLLMQKKIIAEAIFLADIRKFEKVKLINSMLGFNGNEIPTSQIL
jgi:4-amino-4-deoxychorismate lyase